MQNSFMEYPLRDWELESTGSNATILHLVGQVNSIDIVIGEGQCRVLDMPDERHRFFFCKWMSPETLFHVTRFNSRNYH
jgi:hypothetical protein